MQSISLRMAATGGRLTEPVEKEKRRNGEWHCLLKADLRKWKRKKKFQYILIDQKATCSTFKDMHCPSGLHLRDGQGGSQWLHQANHSQSGMVQLWRKHILVEGCFVLRHWDYIRRQEWKRELVTCGEHLQGRQLTWVTYPRKESVYKINNSIVTTYHQVDIVHNTPIIKVHTGAIKPADVGFHLQCPGNDAVGKFFVHCGMLAEHPWIVIRQVTTANNPITHKHVPRQALPVCRFQVVQTVVESLVEASLKHTARKAKGEELAHHHQASAVLHVTREAVHRSTVQDPGSPPSA